MSHGDDRTPKPPMPAEVLDAILGGATASYDEESGQWVVGDDPGFDPDDDIDGDGEDGEDGEDADG